MRTSRDERGVVLIMAVAGLVLALVASALSVDLGRQALDKRKDQSLADMAALDAVRVLAGAATPPAAQTAAQAAAATSAFSRNGFSSTKPGNQVVATVGSMNASNNFVAGVGTSAVQVQVFSTIDYVFAPGSRNLVATAVAAAKPAEAEFSVGSTLASIDTSKSALDSVFGDMLGTNFSAVSYQGLARGNVSLQALQTKLLAMGYDVGTPTKLMTTSIEASDLLTATAQALGDQSGADAAAAKAEMNDIPIASIPNLGDVRLDRLVSVSQPATDSALATTVNVFQLVTGSAQIANGTNFVAVPGITVNVPGVANVSFALSVIEPAQVARGPVGIKARNSQVKLRLNIGLQAGPLALLAPVDLTLDFVTGYADGELTAIRCAAPLGISIRPTTSAAVVSGSGTILPPLAGTLAATGSLAATSAGAPLDFAYTSQFAPPVGPSPAFFRQVGAASLDLSPAAVVVTGSGGLLAGTVATTVQGLLPAILTEVDTVGEPLLRPILQALGLNLAGADITAFDIFPPPPACSGGTPVLVK